MPFNKSAEELLEITGPIDITDVKNTIEWLKQNNVRPSKGRTLYFMQNNKKVLYSVNQIFKILNNNVKNNNIKLETDDVDSFQIYKIFNGFEYDDNFKLIAPWNDEGKKIINKYRNEILEYAVSLGYELNDLPIQYTAIKLNDRNFAEVHYPDKHSQVRIDIFYDRIPDNLNIKVHSERYDDDRRYSLNGKYELCLMEETVEEVKEYLRYCKENKEVILNYKSNQHKQDEIVQNPQNLNEGIKQPLNQILYGPPGTGKTYNTVIKAMEIIDNKKYENVSKELYADLKTKFNERRKQGRIEFVTFHQSYSYEEFVEGIKPDTETWGSSVEKLTYKGCDGVFKKICECAEKSLYQNKDNTDIAYTDFNTTFNVFKETYPQGSDFEKLHDLKYSEDFVEYKFGKQQQYRKIDLKKIREIFDNESKYETAIDFNNDYNGNYSLSCYHFAFYKELEKLRTEINKSVLNKIIKNDNKDFKINENAPNYVLIIDEINRGNISKIFGELITLIEDDKRSVLKVKLPYSHKDFSVPKNLYIIGTMNTSDRSIASIDIALRRRFKFKEMMPKSNIEGFREDFKEYFDILNRRISFLLDRDHQIGHSYFLNEKEKLEDVWFDNVMPLLNEYFYGDWDKLQNILGYAQNENKVEKNQKYSSFIKKICAKDLNLKGDTSCLEDCYYDFVSKDEIDFKKALENAFGKNDKKVVSDSESKE